jgi:hypothetical protein
MTVNYGLKAASCGLTVDEFDEVTNAYRVPIQSGCAKFHNGSESEKR